MFGICSELDTTGQLASLAGFSSKMGLATGPMVGALLLTDNEYFWVINIATIALIVCATVIYFPARSLDRSAN